MSRWFRLYDDLVNDPKVQTLPDDLFKATINLWCLASKNGGELPSNSDIAFGLRVTIERVTEILTELNRLGLVDGRKPHNWDARQFKSDVSTERVKQFRKRNETVSETVNETPPEQIQSRTEQKERADAQKIVFTEEVFEEFWTAYPRKIAKGSARESYRAALARASPEEILDGVKRYVASKPDPKFTKHPASWLDADRWLDEETKAQTMTRGPWKPFDREPEVEKPPADERKAQVERALKRTASGVIA